jgi:hypothetical protein
MAHICHDCISGPEGCRPKLLIFGAASRAGIPAACIKLGAP